MIGKLFLQSNTAVVASSLTGSTLLFFMSHHVVIITLHICPLSVVLDNIFYNPSVFDLLSIHSYLLSWLPILFFLFSCLQYVPVRFITSRLLTIFVHGDLSIILQKHISFFISSFFICDKTFQYSIDNLLTGDQILYSSSTVIFVSKRVFLCFNTLLIFWKTVFYVTFFVIY